MVPPCSDRISRVPSYSTLAHQRFFSGTGLSPPAAGLSRTVPLRIVDLLPAGLFRVRSPLLAESRLISFPPGTEMFQFPGFASGSYGFRYGYPHEAGGFPHSDISGSKPVAGSPKLIAGYHVLHRLLSPRHPPYALADLTI